jgi:hypothetical protein
VRTQDRKVGRPSAADKDREQIEEIFERHADGEALKDICRKLGIKPAAFRTRVRKDSALSEEWEAVRREYVHSLFDELASVTRQLRDAEFGGEDSAKVNALRAAQDGLKHITARLNPSAYGEQKAGAAVPTIIINTTLPIGPGDKAPLIVDGDFTIEVPRSLAKPSG